MASVTVCLPTYNAGTYLDESLRSAVEQTHRDIEVLVVDNCSTDGTQEMVTAWESQDARIRYVRNSSNLGMVRNFNRCLELADGEYIKFLCADDLLAPACVERMLAAIQARPDAALVASARRLIGPDGENIGEVRYVSEPELRKGRQALSYCFHRRNIVGEPTAALFRKADARRGFDVSYLQAFDVEMWLRLLESGDLLLLPEALCSIRLHPEQATKANLRSGQVVEDKRRLFREFATQSREWGSLLDRAMWDLRMASSVARSGPQTARLLKESGIREVYFPDFFRHGLLPAASLVQKLASCRLRR
jgi:glycosyltransferase involved in cell wall biosynthesis